MTASQAFGPCTFELPLRWADLDVLNHVNNVRYLDFAVEARAAHVAAGELPPAPTAAIGVDFIRPLLLGRTPLVVTSRQDGDALTQEIAPRGASSAFARVVSHLAGPVAPMTEHLTGPAYRARLRRSDLGPDGFATMPALFELTQEARIASFGRLRDAGGGAIVVAHVDLVLGERAAWDATGFEAHTSITHVGRSSYTVSTLLDGGRLGRADAVLVGFDAQAQRSRQLSEAERSVLLEWLEVSNRGS